MLRFRPFSGLLVSILLVFATVSARPFQNSRPKLLVLVVFDQLRGDYLSRWDHLFSPDGFRKLTREGAWFTNCHYPYSMTVTGAGHASLGTGCLPSQHGIVENDWFDRREGRLVYCATLGDRYRMVPVGSKSKTGKNDGGAPARLLAPTIGDAVKRATNNRGKVIGISLKDRGGILPTGAKADLCYWYDDNQGAFVTSNYYADRLPTYMARFNAQKYADRWFGKDWTRLRGDIDYTLHSGLDDIPGEGDEKHKFSTTFPHRMTGGERKPGSKYFDCVYNSPFGNELTWAAAQVVIENEQLGQDDETDFLTVSFSSNDAIGHLWGPDSQEVLDVTLRSDLLVAEMIRYLDSKIGRSNYLLALSADHGVCPLPEVAHRYCSQATRVDPKRERMVLEEHLNAKFSTRAKWIETITGAGIYLNYGACRGAGRPRGEVELACRDWLLEQPYVQTVYTRTQLLAGVEGDALFAKARASFHPDRSPDLMPVLKPYVFISTYRTGTTHGSPHEYDTHVPLIVFGGGVSPQIRGERVMPQAAAVILARSIGQTLQQAVAEVPLGLLGD